MSSATSCDALDQRLERYLGRQWGEKVAVRELTRIPGGASRETYRFDAEVGGQVKGMILRRDPVGGLIDTDRQTEFLAYRSFHGIVPVPEPLTLEPEGGALERPFFIMSRIDGGQVPSVMNLDPYGEHAATIGRELFAILGRIARCDPATLPIKHCCAAPTLVECWREALDYWASVIERDERHPQPIAHAAIRRLRRNPPKPAKKISVVHGDYRSGNFMHDGNGKILAVLDWEMAHLGDAVEDLAWCFDPLWNHFDDARVAGTIPEAEAIAIWEHESGLRVDPATLAWWKLFSAVKGCAIWTTSAKEFIADGSDLLLGFTGTYTARRHDRIMADRLTQLVEEGWS
ncbi:MAG: phosphotransferase family protein [Xanthobacteraceae bacterium]|nr:phosphotransferase family protein [Xanthobacteraceae bacterium]